MPLSARPEKALEGADSPTDGSEDMAEPAVTPAATSPPLDPELPESNEQRLPSEETLGQRLKARLKRVVSREGFVPDLPPITPLARYPIFVIAIVVMGTLLAFSNQYGFHGDELYFLAAGRHLDWGYADQPPLVPLIARLMDLIFHHSVIGLRLPSILMTGTGVVLTGLIARDLGGIRKAQITAAGAYACSPFLMGGAGHILATHTVDAFLWTLTSWLVVRWVRTRAEGAPNDRLLLLIGIVTALALQAKWLIPAFWAFAIIGVLIFGPRDMLRRPMLWLGGAIAVLTSVPTIIWQAANGWPQLEMNKIVEQEVLGGGGQYTFLQMGLLQAGVVVGAVLYVFGAWWLLRSPRLAPYRFLGLTIIGTFALFWITSGRAYYPGGLFALGFAAGSVEIVRYITGKWWIGTAIPAFLVSAAVALNGLPVYPISSYAGQPYTPVAMALEEYGWPQLADDVAAAYHSLPPSERANVAIVTDNYWQASALDEWGDQLNLPRSHSPARGYYYFGAPPDSATTTLFVGATRKSLSKSFTDVHLVARVNNEHNINNSSQHTPIWLLRGQKKPWSKLWPEFQHMTFAGA